LCYKSGFDDVKKELFLTFELTSSVRGSILGTNRAGCSIGVGGYVALVDSKLLFTLPMLLQIQNLS